MLIWQKNHPASYPRTGIECRFPHLSEKRTYLVSYLLSGTGTSNGTCEFESFPDKIADLNYIHDLLDEFEINIEKKKTCTDHPHVIRPFYDHDLVCGRKNFTDVHRTFHTLI